MSGRSRGSTDSRTDEALVLELRALGDTMAFEVLMRRYERPLFGFIFRQVGDRTHAQDLYQQTVLKALDNIESCTSPDRFKTWAFSIASNLCRNYRREHPRRMNDPQLDLANLASQLPSPEQSAQDHQTGVRIAAALGALPDAQREVFVLYHYTHLSYEEIGDATGVPVGTVKSRMNAALVQLCALLATLAEEKR